MERCGFGMGIIEGSVATGGIVISMAIAVD